MLKPLIIGIAGGSGSGKSTVARNVAELLTTSSVAFIDMDAYYKNHPEPSLDERRKLNWDHPDAFDYDLLCKHLESLSKRRPIEKPEYDFVSHLRDAKATPLSRLVQLRQSCPRCADMKYAGARSPSEADHPWAKTARACG